MRHFRIALARAPLKTLAQTGHSLPFSFAGLVAGSVVYSLPVAVQPFQAAFRGVGREMVQSALAATTRVAPKLRPSSLRMDESNNIGSKGKHRL